MICTISESLPAGLSVIVQDNADTHSSSLRLVYVLAFALGTLGLVFIYKPKWLVRLNKVARDRIFNDNLILLERRKKGLLFFLIFVLLSYWGYNRMQYAKIPGGYAVISTDRLLYQSLHHLRSKHLNEAKVLCEKILAREPNNAGALYLLGATHIMRNNFKLGKILWTKGREIDPDSSEAKHLKFILSKLDDVPVSELSTLE